MLSPEESRKALVKLFQRQPVADLDTLLDVLNTTSRMSVFRRLSLLGYLTSYSHNGRYYTLANVPEFDAEGLWRCQGICFSRQGSLKATVEDLVHVAKAGRTHAELSVRLQVRVHNALLELVRQGRIGRELLGALYLYVSADPEAALAQVARREELEAAETGIQTAPLSVSLIVEVLVEVIHGAQVISDPSTVCERLNSRSVSVTLEQVEDVYRVYGLKKTLKSRSPRSQ
ncbi:MAG: hypothetical protein HY323_00265 [Betaproteobacteria bacterium]|nr:hypothetical protein [Betaproteobacteria bacterium]